MKNKKNTFILYTNLLEKCQDLSNEQLGELFRAILIHENYDDFDYQITDPMAKMAFSMIKVDLDANSQKYQEICDKRRQAGANGGRPKQTEQEPANAKFAKQEKQLQPNGYFAKQKNQMQASKPDNDSDNENDNEIRESDNLAKPCARFSSLSDITETEIQQVAKDYQVTPAFVRNCFDDLKNYCDSKGKRYKNYLAALRNFVKGDLNHGAKNAAQLATPSLFRKTQDNPDLVRQSEIVNQSPRAPATEAEIQNLRAAMPEFIQRKLAAREVA